MDYTAHVSALASVIMNVARDVQITRAKESCTYSGYEIRVYAWFLDKVTVHPRGGKVAVRYPVGPKVYSSKGDAWATSLIERALELLEDTPYEIPLLAGLITHEHAGCTSYQAA